MTDDRHGRRRARAARAAIPSGQPVPSSGEDGWPTWLPACIVTGFTLLALALHLFGFSQRPLWSDEASTYWTVQASLGQIILGARTDGTPPLHFVLVLAATRLLGTSEFVLRLPSLVAACLLVPSVYGVTRSMAGTRAALIGAALAALSPLVHYYSVEARGYALLQLETVGIVYAAWKAVQRPQRLSAWALLAGGHALQLWTHNYALFVLPAVPLVCLAFGGASRVALAAKAGAAACAALAAYLPWFFVARAQAALGIADWIAPFWEKTPPMAAVARSLEVFGFGGSYPGYLSYLGEASAARPVSIALTLIVLVAATAWRWPSERPQDGHPPARAMLTGVLLLPLAGAWLASFFLEPLYLVGRYDTIVLPVFLVVFAAGLERLTRAKGVAGWTAVALTAILGVLTHATSLVGAAPVDADVAAARHLAREAGPADLVVATGLRRPVVAYYLDRAGHLLPVASYPTEVGAHPGWYSAARLLTDRGRLSEDAERLVASLAAGAAGRRVWVLLSAPNEVDQYLFAALARRFVVDEERTHRECRLFSLVLSEAKSGGGGEAWP